MNLQNGYKVIYEKIADGERSFYATQNTKCDPAVDDLIAKVTIGEYKLIYEKDGQFFGSTTGIPTENDYCFAEFDRVFKENTSESTTEDVEEDAPIVEDPEDEIEGTPEDESEKDLEGEINGIPEDGTEEELGETENDETEEII